MLELDAEDVWNISERVKFANFHLSRINPPNEEMEENAILQNIHDILLCIHPSSARKHHHFFEQKVLNYLIIFIFFKNNFREK